MAGLTHRQIQTKFSSPSAQNRDNMPYDPDAPLEEQVTTSIRSSLANLTTPDCAPYIDCLVLHSPLNSDTETLAAFKLINDTFVPHQVKLVGISNCPQGVLRELHGKIHPPLSVIQNRFHGRTAWEVGLRAFCREPGIVFQSFWTLTANPKLRSSVFVAELARAADVEPEVALYALVLGLGNTAILDGTTSEAHMRQDLDGLAKVGTWMEGDGKVAWEGALRSFKQAIGET